MSRLKGDGGTSLAEMLVGALLTTIVMAGASGMAISASRTERFAQDTRSNLDDARVAADQLRKDLRESVRVYAVNPQGVASSASVLALWIDEDEDGVQDLAEQVTYRLEGASPRVELVRTNESGTARRVLARNLSVVATAGVPASGFSYDVAPPATAVVGISLTLDAGSAGTAGPFQAIENVRLRNAPSQP